MGPTERTLEVMEYIMAGPLDAFVINGEQWAVLWNIRINWKIMIDQLIDAPVALEDRTEPRAARF